MARQELVLYLTLAPEFGGTRFGPFDQVEVRLGSAEGSNNITLPESLGITPHHVKVMQQSGMGLIVAPVDRAAPVYVWKDGAHRPQLLSAPVAVRAGDSFSLVTPEGPRFTLEMLPPPPKESGGGDRPWMNGKRPDLGDFKEEGIRQVWVRILTTGPGQFASRMWTFFRTGEFLRPRNLFAMVGVLGGYVTAAGLWFASLSTAEALDEAAEELADCEENAALNSDEDKSIVDYPYEALARNITNLDALEGELKNDAELLAAVKKEARRLQKVADIEYEWLLSLNTKRTNVDRFRDLRETLAEEDGLPPELSHLLAYAGLTPKPTKEMWLAVEDSSGEKVCAHGYLWLTWRQAHQLGLEPQLDGYLRGETAGYDQSGSEQALARLQQTADVAAFRDFDVQAALYEGKVETDIEAAGNREFCLFVDEADKRANLSSLKSRLVQHLGPTPRAPRRWATPTRSPRGWPSSTSRTPTRSTWTIRRSTPAWIEARPA